MIQSVSHGHRGMYTCMAKNNAGTATSVAELKVNGQKVWKIRQGKKDIGHNCLHDFILFSFFQFFISVPPELGSVAFAKEIFDEGASAQIMCSVSDGDEPLAITWSFHGNDISSDSSGIVTSNFGSKTSFLMMQKVFKDKMFSNVLFISNFFTMNK